ncbi:O-methyltransferase [Streptomyces cavernae]|uniref:O-methyltransferase n=1 Tax=Streptomyces cavernae TaxID=2259034 RepID=UPI000FEBD670|nr:class I SAM-dependent methyltransferase [Streptomyces cavernae]
MQDLPTAGPAALPGIIADSGRIGFTMWCEARVGSLLATLASSKPGGRILELGTGTGVGAAWLLDGMDADARLISVEVDPAMQAVALNHLGRDPRVTFTTADADAWLSDYDGEPFDLAFVDCPPGKSHRLADLLALLRVGGLYVVDDMVLDPTWPDDYQRQVGEFLEELPTVTGLRATPLHWASGVVLGVRV